MLQIQVGCPPTYDLSTNMRLYSTWRLCDGNDAVQHAATPVGG